MCLGSFFGKQVVVLKKTQNSVYKSQKLCYNGNNQLKTQRVKMGVFFAFKRVFELFTLKGVDICIR